MIVTPVTDPEAIFAANSAALAEAFGLRHPRRLDETHSMNPTLAEALRLAHDGWSVFPCAPRSKRPLTRHGLNDATTCAEQIQSWWRDNPDANLAIAVPAEKVVLDFDALSGLDLMAERGLAYSPDDPVAATPRGGAHMWLKLPDDVRVKNAVGILPGVDVRTAGGYVLVAPSVTEAGSYEWLAPLDRDRMPVAPGWLCDLLRGEKPVNPEMSAVPPPVVAEQFHSLAKAIGEVPTGRRNDTAARLTGHLLRHSVDPYVVFVLITAWNATCCQPPLPDHELSQIMDSIGRMEFGRRVGESA